MTTAIGVFDKEEGVLEAIKRFQAARTNRHNLRIVLKNKESAPLLVSDSSIPIEEVYEIREAQDVNQAGTITPLSAAPFAAGSGYTAGSTGLNGGPTGIAAGAVKLDNEPDTKDVLHDIGIEDKFIEPCKEAIDQGYYLLVADTDNEAAAGALLLQSGAYKVLY